MGESLYEDTNEMSSECLKNVLKCIDLENIKSSLIVYVNKALEDFWEKRVEIENIALAIVRDSQDTMAMEVNSYVKYSKNDYALVDASRGDNEDTTKEKVLEAIKNANDNRNYICTTKRFFGDRHMHNDNIMFTHDVIWCLSIDEGNYGYKGKVFGKIILQFLEICFKDSKEIERYSNENIADYWEKCATNERFDFRKAYINIIKEKYDIENFNRIAITPYEKRECFGKILLVSEDTNLDNIASFAVKFNIESQQRLLDDVQGTRKLLETCKDVFFLAADLQSRKILGLIWVNENCKENIQGYPSIIFYGNARWKLAINDETIFCYEWGNYYATKRERMKEMKNEMPKEFCFFDDLFQTLEKTSHGAMVIVANDAKDEAERLSKVNRAIRVFPFDIKQQKIKLLSGMFDVDGAVLIDFEGFCYAFGVILDGRARAMGVEKRGARYNSAITYIAGEERIAFIASEDKAKGVEVFYGRNIDLIDKE